jgi:hypothetical protein
MIERTRLVNVRLKKNDTNKVQVVPIGDMHLGYPTTDLTLLKDTLNECLEKRIYVLGMGDMVECGTTSSVGDSVYRQRLNPQEQIEEIIVLFKPLADAGLIIGFHHGNHERRLMKAVGLDIMKFICQSLSVRFLGHAAFHVWRIGKQNYSVFSTHGSSGARLPYSKIRAALDVFRYVDTEIVLYGHMHSLDHHTTLYHRVNINKGTLDELRRHAVLTGSFMNYFDSYGEEKNLPPVRTGVARITLDDKRHEVSISL